jgi:hypothetical protein
MSQIDKLDAPSKYLLSMLDKLEAESQQRVGILLRGKSKFGDAELDALRADGAEIRTVAGDVLSASIALGSLPELTRHDFVVSVQISQPLRPEGPDPDARGGYYDVG